MLKFKFLIIFFFTLMHCSLDTKSGLWENKNTKESTQKISKTDFNKDLTFEEFKEKVVLYGKKSKYPKIMNKNE